VAYVICCVCAYRAGTRNEVGKEIGWVLGGLPVAAAAFFIPMLIAIVVIVVVAFAGLALIGSVLGGGGSSSGGIVRTAIRRQQFRDDVETSVHNAHVEADARHYWENHSHPLL